MELNIYTDGCARTLHSAGKKEYHAGWGFWGYEESNKEKLLEGYGPIGLDGTNNQGELRAAIEAVIIAANLGCKKLNLFVDSMYVKDGCTNYIKGWARNGWKTKTGDNVKNQQYWKDYVQAEKLAEKSGMSITFIKVKGHSGNEGNDKADEIALKGAELSFARGEKELFLSNFGKEDTRKKDKEVEAKKEVPVKKKKVPVKDPLIIGTRVITLTSTPAFKTKLPDSEEECSVVYSSKYPTDPKVADRELGVEGADAMQCVTLTNEEDFQLKAVSEKVAEIADSNIVLPVVNYWDKLSSTATRKGIFEGDIELHTRNDIVYYVGEQKNRDTKLMMPVEIPVARITKIPKRAWFAIEHLEHKFAILTEFLEGNMDDEDTIDVTDVFLSMTEDKKGKVKVVPNPDTKGKDTIDVKMPCGETRKLKAMIDMISITSINTILKTHPDVKFYVVIHSKNDVQYRFSFIAKSSTGSMIMDNPYTNVSYLPLRKKK